MKHYPQTSIFVLVELWRALPGVPRAAAQYIISTQIISTPIHNTNNNGIGRRASGDDVVVDLAAYARAAQGRNTLT